MGEMSLSLLCFSTMNPMDPAGPLDNSVFVVAPHNSYPATQEGMCQVALYPSNQPQVHQLPVNPPGLKPSVSEQPVRRALKEGKALGVRELSLCRPGVTGWSQTGRGEGGDLGNTATPNPASRVGADPALPNQDHQKSQLCNITRVSVGGLLSSALGI